MSCNSIKANILLADFFKFNVVDDYIRNCYLEFDKLRDIHRYGGRASSFSISGTDGMGKKTIINSYKYTHCKLPKENYSICPIIEVKLVHPINYISLIRQVLVALHSFGATTESKKTTAINLKKKLFNDLDKVKVELIVIHNFHLIEKINDIVIKESVYNLLLDVLHELKIPIVFILNNMNLSELTNVNFLNSVAYKKHLDLFLLDDKRFSNFLCRLLDKTDMPYEFKIEDIAPPIYVISEGRLVTIRRLIDKLFEVVLYSKVTIITLKQLTQACNELYPNKYNNIFDKKVYIPALKSLLAIRSKQNGNQELENEKDAINKAQVTDLVRTKK